MVAGDIVPFNGEEPLKEISAKINRNRNRSFGQNDVELNDQEYLDSLKDMITPPSSTLRKTPVGVTDNVTSSLKHPLSPELSSPIAPSKAKKQKSDGGSRSNGNLTIEELLQSLKQRKISRDCNSKPPYSYATLIGLAILQSAGAKLTLSQIYSWISIHFPYYKQKDAGWQNSIRHNLSLNDAFIKTEKSCDGKGHFWEVKSGFETKFFKGANITLEEIRAKLRDIDEYFSLDGSPEQGIITGEQQDDIAFEHGNSALLHIHSSPNALSSNIKISSQEFGNDKGVNDVGFLNEQKHHALNPPYLLRKYHTSLGLPKLEDFKDFSKEHNLLMYNNTDALTSSSTSSSPNVFKSSHDFKKYTCSFNSSFEELSPSKNRYTSHSLLDPIMTASCGINTPKEVPQMFSTLQSPLSTNLQPPQQHGQVDLLRTPRNPQQQTLERTPCRFMTTPRDESSAMKKWQTPSHLFEDLYCSPIYKYMGSPKQETQSPNPSLGKILTPKKYSEVDISMGRSKISASGLFGVDVYAVWKRATNNVNGMDSRISNETRKAEISEPDSHNTDRYNEGNKTGGNNGESQDVKKDY
ncbi:hypothetical protein HG535_0A07340 [Zygotorulaspora mrakii]|uniref:Fork-head domain-containing protein n=1 Tax=Zygotorulaspora mrakii TaxID=42260 RepID=A0A7H9AYY2_ZYGMR|nr:uncharacterized protein HG535_0A07340 [Zygotorulaspora mrakii]QLG70792.1 hypothetical protein HG535_0A07340 [Zygotorulaspora mrakii]